MNMKTPPPAMALTIKQAASRGYIITWRANRNGSMVYRINGMPERNASDTMERVDRLIASAEISAFLKSA